MHRRVHAYLRDGEPWGGLRAYAQSFAGLILVVPEVVALVFLILTRLALRRARVTLGIACVVAAYGAFHMVSVLGDGTFAFVCLGFGVVAWSTWLQARDRLRAPADGTGRETVATLVSVDGTVIEGIAPR